MFASMIKRLALLLLLLLVLACGGNVKRVADVPLIAHAGGMVAGDIMTNSVEAIYAARDNGYKYIELDLSYTADSFIVAVHDWGSYNRAVGLGANSDAAPLLADFCFLGLPGGYTPLLSHKINDFFQEHDSLYLVTDKISDPDVLDGAFPGLRSRMVVEAFNYDHYVELKRRGYAYVTYSCLADDIVSATLKHIVFHWLFPGPKIDKLALHTSAFDYSYLKFLMAVADFEISLFTINRMEDIPEMAREGLRFIYTDSLRPSDLK